MKKYNTLILLIAFSLIASHIIGIWQQMAVSHLSMDDYLSQKIVFTRISIFLKLLIYIPPALWAFRNSPNQLNKFVSFLVILFSGFFGVLVILVLDGIEYLNDIKITPNQQVDPIVTTPVDEVEAQGTQGHP